MFWKFEEHIYGDLFENILELNVVSWLEVVDNVSYICVLVFHTHATGFFGDHTFVDVKIVLFYIILVFHISVFSLYSLC